VHRPVWWRLEVRQWSHTKCQQIPVHRIDYRHQAAAVRAHQIANLEFSERIPVPACEYDIWLEVREGVPQQDENGKHSDEGPAAGRLAHITVH
jgi:hypothetical protein